jgi:REP element-mobilizing transposase RayT
MKKRIFYKRKLPHWQPAFSDFFVTYRLAGSVPVNVIQYLSKKYEVAYEKEKYFAEWEYFLESSDNGPRWLSNASVAELVLNSLKYKNNLDYSLWAATIMSNHVHIVLRNKADLPLDKILQNHKKFTAVHCNKILNRKGPFWAEESFDTLIRNSNHLFNCINYCINNPVKAGLVCKWTDWPWTYLDPTIEKFLK